MWLRANIISLMQGQVWCRTSIINPSTWEEQEFKASLGHLVRPCFKIKQTSEFDFDECKNSVEYSNSCLLSPCMYKLYKT